MQCESQSQRNNIKQFTYIFSRPIRAGSRGFPEKLRSRSPHSRLIFAQFIYTICVDNKY